MRYDQYLGLFLYFHFSESINILCVFPVPSISHQIIFQPIWKELSLRGHDVTVITPNPLNDKLLSNLTEIDVNTRAYEYLISSNHVKYLDTHESVFSRVLFYYDHFHNIVIEELENDEVSKLIESNRTFDLIMVQGQMIMPLVYGFGAKYKSPVIECAKILIFLPVPSISNQVVFQPIWKELSLRGHNVTVITPNPLQDASLTNLTEIDVGSRAYRIVNSAGSMVKMAYSQSIFSKISFCYEILDSIIREELEQEEVSELIRGDEVFELVLLQVPAIHPLVYGFGAKYGLPVIAISSLEVFLHIHDIFGNPTHPIASPDMMLAFEDELSFVNKLESFLFNIWYRIYYYWYALPRADRTARKYFGNDIPYLGDIERNTSLLLMNVNPVMHHIRPNVPNIIEINQVHIKKKKPLPEDIKKYLDSSPQGVIYFSLGSNVKSVNLTVKIRTVIIEALADLPYNVVWKWENDYLPGKPDNVMLRKWLPQQDILGHSNVKVFVTQGGLQSIEESITNEVPMVGLPFITDQPSNVKRIVKLGMGVGLDPQQMTREQLRDAILEVAEKAKYKKQMKHYRAILTDQPMKGVEKAIWWIEYVIRHKGAKHLRSAAADMSFYEYFMIDIILFLIVCIISMMYVIVKMSQFMLWIIRITRMKVKIN